MAAFKPHPSRMMSRGAPIDGGLLRRLRDHNTLTQAGLSEKLKEAGTYVCEEVISKAERGKRIAYVAIQHIADFFKVTPEELRGISNTSTTQNDLDCDTRPTKQPAAAPVIPREFDSEICNYLQVLRNLYDRLALFSRITEGQRKQLYRDRTLSPAGQKPAERSGLNGNESTAIAPTPPFAGASGASRPDVPLAQSRLLEILDRSDGFSVVTITGEAGSGKTTLLEHIAWALAADAAAPIDIRRVPFLVNLKCWRPRLHGSISDLASKVASRLKPQVFAELCDSGRAVFLLDGLDEVRPARRRLALIEWLDRQIADPANRGSTWVISGRPWALAEMPLRALRTQALTIDDFSQTDIEQYIHDYFDSRHERADEVIRQLAANHTMKRVVSRPLFLMLLCFVFEEEAARLPSSENELLDRALRELLRRREVGPEEPVIELLKGIGWRCLCKDVDSGGSAGLSKVEISHYVAASARSGWLKDAFHGKSTTSVEQALAPRSGLLVENGPSGWRFVEETYAEYLAGLWIADQPDDEICRVFVDHIWNPSWQRIFAYVFTELWLNRPALARELTDTIMNEVDQGGDDRWFTLLVTACKLIGRATSDQQTSVELLDRVLTATLAAWRCDVIERGCDAQIVDANNAIAGLSGLCETKVTSAVIRVLNDSYTSLNVLHNRAQDEAARLLGMIATAEAVEALIAALDRRLELASVAIAALGQCASKRALSALLDRYFQWAAQTLVTRPSFLLVGWEKLVNAASDSIASLATDDHARRLVYEVFQKELASPNDSLRAAAALGLGQLGGKIAAEALLQRLPYESNESVRHHIVNALGEIRSDIAVPILVSLATTPTPPFESMGATVPIDTAARHVLVNFTGREVKSHLLPCLNDENENVRVNATLALAYVLRSSIAPVLLELAKNDASSLVRGIAMSGLGSIGALGEARELLLNRARDSSANEIERIGAIQGLEFASVQDTSLADTAASAVAMAVDGPTHFAILALRHIGSTSAVPALLKQLKRSRGQLRIEIVEVLGEVGDDRAVSVLKRLLKQKNQRLVYKAKEALLSLRSFGARNIALKLLHDNEACRLRYVLNRLEDRLDPEEMRLILQSLTYDDVEVRQSAIYAAERAKCSPIPDAIVRMLRDRSSEVRNAVVRMLAASDSVKAIKALMDNDHYSVAAESCLRTGMVALQDGRVLPRNRLKIHLQRRKDL